MLLIENPPMKFREKHFPETRRNDLQSLKTVATIDVPEQAAGIDFWKTAVLSTSPTTW